MKLAHSFPRGARILVGVSGGLDSVALLHLLHAEATRRQWTLGVAHINHRLRGTASNQDEAFVRKLAIVLKLPVYVRKADVRAHAESRKISIEMAAREVRHAAFLNWMKRHRYNLLALAHTQDDQAETVLLRLIRGSGWTGLGAMARERKFGNGILTRPLLGVSKETLRKWALKHCVMWREDVSNTDEHYLRNRVRHELLPLIAKTYNPSIRVTLARMAEVVQAEDNALEDLAATDASACAFEGGHTLNVDCVMALPVARQRRVVRRWLIGADIDPEHLQFDTVDRVLSLCRESAGSKQVDVGSGRSACRSYQALDIDTSPEDERSSDLKTKLRCPGITSIPSHGLRVAVKRAKGFRRPAQQEIGKWPAEAAISAKWLGRAALYVRTVRPGDRFQPLGLDGHRKVQDILVDLKIPKARRSDVFVIEARGQIIWIPGYTIAETCRVPSGAAPATNIIIDSVQTQHVHTL